MPKLLRRRLDRGLRGLLSAIMCNPWRLPVGRVCQEVAPGMLLLLPLLLVATATAGLGPSLLLLLVLLLPGAMDNPRRLLLAGLGCVREL